MKAVFRSKLFPHESRREQDKFLLAGLWEKVPDLARKNQSWMIVFISVTTILVEMAEHLGLIQDPKLFFYGEVILITILLAIAALAKTPSAVLQDARREPTTLPEREEAPNQQQLLEEKIQAAQKEIARDLHDTLGQNISYLRMRLEYFAEGSLPQKESLAVEIRRMAEVADESYDLVRGMLAALQGKASKGLYPLLAGHAQQVAERSDVQIDIIERGCPRPLAANTIFQLFLIFREAIHNIEKHACASQAQVSIEWSETGLRLVISDNGCGFDAVVFEQSGHYGLRNMRERSERLNGQFSIQSTRGSGTTVVVSL